MKNKSPNTDPQNHFDPTMIQQDLATDFVGHGLVHYQTLPSTNELAKALAKEGAVEGTVVIAETQTAGRGRQGRTWLSPPGQGVWMSVILRPPQEPAIIPLMPLAIAVAVEKAMARVCGIKAGIKWPNDLVFEGKKLAGILVESQIAKNQIQSLIVGVGTNVLMKEAEIPAQLAGRISSLQMATGQAVSRLDYLKALVEEVEKVYQMLCSGQTVDILEAWRQKAVTLGKRVIVDGSQGSFSGIAINIDAMGALLVKGETGEIIKVVSGDVSIRSLDGSYI